MNRLCMNIHVHAIRTAITAQLMPIVPCESLSTIIFFISLVYSLIDYQVIINYSRSKIAR